MKLTVPPPPPRALPTVPAAPRRAPARPPVPLAAGTHVPEPPDHAVGAPVTRRQRQIAVESLIACLEAAYRRGMSSPESGAWDTALRWAQVLAPAATDAEMSQITGTERFPNMIWFCSRGLFLLETLDVKGQTLDLLVLAFIENPTHGDRVPINQECADTFVKVAARGLEAATMESAIGYLRTNRMDGQAMAIAGMIPDEAAGTTTS